jgi:hypothetical protein
MSGGEGENRAGVEGGASEAGAEEAGAEEAGAEEGGALAEATVEGGASALRRLAELLREQGGLMATLVVADAPRGAGRPAPGPAQTAAAGPRAQRAREEYELLVETIYEGYLLHYGAGRVVAAPEADLGLLAGDRLYALGLARLVALGDTQAVAELADTITLSALAQAAGDPELAQAVWEAGAHAVGWGCGDAHVRAKRLAFARAPEAIEAMRTSAAGIPASP